ncbi:DUF4190 domain-containing protein [Candidatus Woesearchaeota archaeon]|nr:DUF4190 domain-containing protein [Candidatus Woesearchaeota archaeon]
MGTNTFAKLSFILAFFFWMPMLNFFTNTLAAVFGFVALKEMKKTKQKGKWMALTGITVGIVATVLTLIGGFVYFFFPEILA